MIPIQLNHDLIKSLSDHLNNRVLPFWMRMQDEKRGGWFGMMDFDLNVIEESDRACLLNSRILWTFSTAARVTSSEVYAKYARRALAYLPRFEDKVNGGVFWSVTADGQPKDTTKHTYCQAFAIYGLAAYVRLTGDQPALDRAMALFDLIETRCSDEGGYGEAFKADFSPESNEKLSENGVMAGRTMNTLLHVLEAYAELYRAHADERVRAAGVRCLQRFLHVMYNEEKARLEVFFDREYHPLLDMQSFGHDIEASWLIWDAVQTLLPEEERAPYRAMCTALAASVFERAFTDHGLKNESVDGEVNETRIWWVQAETVLGLANAWQMTGDDKYSAALTHQWQYVQDVICDKRPGGEWYWCCHEDGTPYTEKCIVEEWKCPYHNGRMCLRLMEQAAAE